jgi:hypothetical protein
MMGQGVAHHWTITPGPLPSIKRFISMLSTLFSLCFFLFAFPAFVIFAKPCDFFAFLLFAASNFSSTILSFNQASPALSPSASRSSTRSKSFILVRRLLPLIQLFVSISRPRFQNAVLRPRSGSSDRHRLGTRFQWRCHRCRPRRFQRNTDLLAQQH